MQRVSHETHVVHAMGDRVAHVFTVATSFAPNVSNLELSLLQHGWSYEILALGEKWQGLKTKMRHYASACASVPADAIVVCADSADVIVVETPEAFVARLELAFPGVDIILSAEETCWEGRSCLRGATRVLREQYGEDEAAWPPRRRFINSGLVGGRAGAVGAMFQWMLDTHQVDDQMGMVKYVESRPAEVRVALDDALRVFATDSFAWTLPIVPRQGDVAAHVLQGDTARPVFMHFPNLYFSSHILGQANTYDAVARGELGARYMRPNVGRYAVYIMTWCLFFLLIATLAVTRGFTNCAPAVAYIAVAGVVVSGFAIIMTRVTLGTN